MINQRSIGSLALVLATCGAMADISTYSSDISMIADITNQANFNDLVQDDSLNNYQEDGLQVSVNRNYFSWNAPGFNGSEMFYASTGSLELVDITLTSGGYFGDIDMEISSGWSASTADTMYLWVQLYDEGNLVTEFDIDTMTGDFVGFYNHQLGIDGSGLFDQILIGSYADAQTRDSHNPSARNAIAIDNISVGTFVPVPAPGTLAISGIALLGLRRRR